MHIFVIFLLFLVLWNSDLRFHVWIFIFMFIWEIYDFCNHFFFFLKLYHNYAWNLNSRLACERVVVKTWCFECIVRNPWPWTTHCIISIQGDIEHNHKPNQALKFNLLFVVIGAVLSMFVMEAPRWFHVFFRAALGILCLSGGVWHMISVFLHTGISVLGLSCSG